MARRIRHEQINLDIIIGGNQAQKEILDLQKKNRGLNQTFQEQKEELRQLKRQYGRNSQEVKEHETLMKKNRAEYKKNIGKLYEMEKALKVTDMTMEQLGRRSKMLRIMISKMSDPVQIKKFKAELVEVNARMSTLNGKAAAHKISFGTAANWLNKYQTLLLSVTATLTGFVFSIQKFLDYQGKLSDAMADTRKTTELTNQEVQELGKRFGAFKTRTARIELFGLAEEAGRLGIRGVDNIAAFTQTLNKMKVALGDELSDTQIREVGKISNIYSVGAETGRDMAEATESVGSAINKVASSGNSTSAFLVDYLKRQSGVAKSAKVSAADNIAYAATFDEIGQSQEIAATAMNKVWIDMFKNPNEYAKIAGVSIKEFNDLLAKDSNAAMMLFLKGLNGNNEGLSVMTKKMEELDAGGTRGVNALIALSGATDRLQELQELSNESLILNTSLTEEYNVKNNNLAASLEKINKKVKGFINQNFLADWILKSVEAFALLIGATDTQSEQQERWRDRMILALKILLVLTTAIVSYKTAAILAAAWTNRNTIATNLNTIAQKANAITGGLLRVVLSLLQLGYAKLTGNTVLATRAQHALNLAWKANPLGIIITALTIVVGLLWAYNSRTKQVVKAQENLNEVQEEARKNTSAQISELKKLITVARDETISKEQRLAAIKRLNEISPEYLGNLSLETIKTNEATTAINNYIKALNKKSLEEAFSAKRTEIQKKIIEEETKDTKSYRNRIHKVNDGLEGFFGGVLGQEEKQYAQSYDEYLGKRSTLLWEYIDKGYNTIVAGELADRDLSDDKYLLDKRRNEVSALKKELKALNEQELKAIREGDIDLGLDEGSNQNSNFTGSTSSTNVSNQKKSGPSESEQERKRLRDAYKARMEELSKLIKDEAEEVQRLKHESKLAEIEVMDDGFEKEKAKIVEEGKWKFQQYQNELNQNEIFIKALEQEKEKARQNRNKGIISEEELTLQLKNLDKLIEQTKLKNAELTAQNLSDKKLELQKINKLESEFILKDLDERQQSFEKKRRKKQTEFQIELNELITLEQAKAKLKSSLSEEELRKVRTLEQAKAKLQEQFNKEELELESKQLQDLINELQTVMSSNEWQGIDLDLLTDEQKEQMLAYVDELKQKIAELKAELGKPTGKNTDNTEGSDPYGQGTQSDILGMTPESWDTLFQNLANGKLGLQEFMALAGAMQQAFSQYYEFINANEQKTLEKFEKATNEKKDALQKQLDEGYISQETYDKEVSKLDDKLNKRKAEIEYKQAKRQRSMALAQVAMNTAQAIMGIWAQVPKFDFGATAAILTGVVTAMGALQAAMILKQPLPAKGYEKGLYKMLVEREQDGQLFEADYGGNLNSGYVTKPTYFQTSTGPILTGENSTSTQPEVIIDRKAYSQFDPQLKNDLYYGLAKAGRVKGFENGFYPDNATVTEKENNTESEMMSMIISLLDKNTQVMEKVMNEGIKAVVDKDDYKSMRNIQKGINNYNRLKSESKN